MKRRTAVPHASDRNSRSEPFEIFTRPQRSLPARLLGLVLRRRAEITVVVAALLAWAWLTDHLPAWAAGTILGVLAATVAAVPVTRRYVHRRAFAVLTRHRLRSVFVQRRIMNWTGNLPVLLWSRPTPVGERVWLILRAGIDAVDIERNLPYVASGCFARDARVTAVRSMTALVMVDVIRRDPLTRPAARPAPAPQPVPTPVPALRVVRTEKGP